MDIRIVRVEYEDKALLRNLMELCQHDYSEFEDSDTDDHGLFGYKYLDNYWTDAGRHPFILRVDGKLAGFALVRVIDDVANMAEFFIMRKYRRAGVGRILACRVFDMFPGKWRVEQMPRNLPAQAFWRKVISEYTGGRFEDLSGDDKWNGPFQLFDGTQTQVESPS